MSYFAKHVWTLLPTFLVATILMVMTGGCTQESKKQSDKQKHLPPLAWFEKAEFAYAAEDLMSQCILPHRKHVEGKNPLAIEDSKKSIAAVLGKATGKKVRWNAKISSITTDYITAAHTSYFRDAGMFRGDFMACRLSASNTKSENCDSSFAIGRDVSREEAVKYRVGDSFWIQGEVADAAFSEHLTGYQINIYLINVKH